MLHIAEDVEELEFQILLSVIFSQMLISNIQPFGGNYLAVS
jgi:hypothetical protein